MRAAKTQHKITLLDWMWAWIDGRRTPLGISRSDMIAILVSEKQEAAK